MTRLALRVLVTVAAIALFLVVILPWAGQYLTDQGLQQFAPAVSPS